MSAKDSEKGVHSTNSLSRSNSSSSASTLKHESAADSALSAAIDKIGMGSYQWFLFVLCGLGWLTDAMWLESFALIAPAIQQEFHLSDTEISYIMTSVFAGMIIGAAGWGIFSDVRGRKPTFNITLFITSLFGTIMAFSPNYAFLCASGFLMGTGLGGNLPVDGALFIEFIPRNRQNLLTLLSIFWSFGNLVTASFGWSLLPRYSCNKATDHILHDCQSHNNRGWRYVVFAHGLITIVFFFSRFFFFKFHESPKYLLARGRPREALDILYILAAKNKAYDLDIKLEDLMSATDLDNQDKNHCETIDTGSSKKLKISFKTDHLNVLFTKRNARTTITVWLIWTFVAIGYNIFNFLLPTLLLQSRGEDQTVDETYRDLFIILVCGIPGSILATILVSIPRLGQRGSMAISTLLLAVGVLVFGFLKSSQSQLGASCAIAFLQNIMYGVIYAYTPSVFETSVRGSAMGIASALNRIFGCISPLIGGALLSLSFRFPLYASSLCFVICAGFMFSLPPRNTS